eukprot:2100881-Rhodomonas_salina.3
MSGTERSSCSDLKQALPRLQCPYALSGTELLTYAPPMHCRVLSYTPVRCPILPTAPLRDVRASGTTAYETWRTYTALVPRSIPPRFLRRSYAKSGAELRYAATRGVAHVDSHGGESVLYGRVGAP